MSLTRGVNRDSGTASANGDWPHGHVCVSKMLNRPNRAKQYFIKNAPINASGIMMSMRSNQELMPKYAKTPVVKKRVGTGTKNAKRIRLPNAISELLSHLGQR
ncbi:MAG: hypothetical protein P4N60_17645 [Verrucomicrobiae bacterium]|nr:hypothetical protein [Verrucomicrobiae bacterium]